MDEIRAELGKIKGYAEELNIEISKEKIDRLSLRQILVDLRLSSERIWFFLSKLTKTYLEQLKPDSSLQNILLIYEVKQEIDHRFTSLISSVNSVIHQLDETSYYTDIDIRRSITELISSLNLSITLLTDALSLTLTGIAQIEELISNKFIGLSERWAVAICYLSAMEIIVNRKLQKEGIKMDGKDFADKYKALLRILENKGVKVSKLEKELPSAFWKLRNQVVHAGYNPTPEELDLITTWVKKIIKLAID
ncbi:MAG: hypothetical protein DSO07_01920 [Thermoproteota archaeon]|jgi:hypothetical protein|nr:MAG: hypothetical protein DSO07_01920 [Candidatus Korarchaeota archaeon]